MLRQPVECRTCGEVLALQGVALFPLWHSGFLVLKLMSQDPVSPGSRSEATEKASRKQGGGSQGAERQDKVRAPTYWYLA